MIKYKFYLIEGGINNYFDYLNILFKFIESSNLGVTSNYKFREKIIFINPFENIFFVYRIYET